MPTERLAVPAAGRRLRAVRRGTVALLAAIALAPLTACSDPATGAATVGQVVIEPADPVVAVGETMQLTATVRDAGGEPLANRAVVWASADASVATVDANGVVTPVKVGRVQIAASSEGQSGIVELRVTSKRVRSVTVAASASRVQVGDTVSVQVTAKAADGEVLGDRAPTLTTSSSTVATVAPNLRVVALAPGTTQIVADVEGVSGTATLEVVPAAAATLGLSSTELQLTPNQTATLAVTVRDARGNVLSGRTPSFSSSATGVATVTTDGTVRGVAPGTATITVTVEQATATALVRVSVVSTPLPAPVTRIVLSTGDFGLRVGETRQVTATLLDASGTPVVGRPITWSATNGSVASVSSTGLVTALGTGTSRIEVRAEGLTASVTVTVTPVPVARVTVTPGTLSLRVDERSTLTATTSDASGATLTGREVSWSSSAPSVATVSGSGEVRAVSPGSATITATSESVAGTASVTVTAAAPTLPGPPVRLEIVSGNDQQGLQEATLEQPLVVRALDASNRPVPGVFVLWTPSNGGRAEPTLALTDASGLATTRWTLGDKNGGQTMQAVTVGVTPVIFNAVARRR
jgi:trimeric autotransporter adhesin